MRETIMLMADIHNQYLPLEYFSARIPQDGHVWCLGDIVGRGPQPVPTAAQAFRLYNKTEFGRLGWLAGNHDLMVCETIGTANFGNSLASGVGGMQEGAGAMADFTRERLRPSQLEWLKSLPTHSQPLAGIYLAHGGYNFRDGVLDPTATYAYKVDTLARINEMFRQLSTYEKNPPRLMLVGHTHTSLLYRWSPEEKSFVKQSWNVNENLYFENLSKYPVFLNPGSLGFPRSPDTCPSYAQLIIDDEADSLELSLHHAPYDKSKIEELDRLPPAYRQEIESHQCIAD